MSNKKCKLKNRDIRISCFENGIKFWQIAIELGVSAETVSRKLRAELSEEEKERFFKAIENIIRKEDKV